MHVDFQNAFIRLAADAEFRGRFGKDATSTLQAYHLTSRERRALAGIPSEQLDRYAGALLAKRGREFAKVLPYTLEVCPNLVHRYRRWLATHPSPRAATVLAPGLAEALRALEPLGREVMSDPGEASYAADVFAFEALAQASRVDGEPRSWMCRFRADVLLRTLRTGVLPVDPEPAATRYVFTRDGVEFHPIPRGQS